MDPYSILGVSVSSTPEEVAKAYRRKARETHPDLGGSNEDFLKVEEAYRLVKELGTEPVKLPLQFDESVFKYKRGK